MTSTDIDFITRYIALGGDVTIEIKDSRPIVKRNGHKAFHHDYVYDWIREYLNTGAVAERLPDWYF